MINEISSKQKSILADYLSEQVILHIQNTKFIEIISNIKRIPFYKKKLLNKKIDINKIKGIRNLTNLPFTTKEEIRATNPMDRMSGTLEGITYFFSSSGTTGLPTVYPWSSKDDSVLREVSARCMKRVGVEPGNIALILAPLGMPIMGYCMMTQYIASGAGVVPLGAVATALVLKAVNDFPISIIASLPIIGTRASEFIEKRYKFSLIKNKPRYFHCGGDYLSNARRKRIENYWGVICYDFYGLSEIFGPLAGECDVKEGLHIAPDHMIIEVIDSKTKKPVPEGEVGVGVYTTLWDKTKPLVRFWSDDFISINTKKCRCGRTSPRIFYKGRQFNLAEIKGQKIFVKDIEEILLSIPEVGNEWEMRIYGTFRNPLVILTLEKLSRYPLPVDNIKRRIFEYLKVPVEVEVKKGSLSREEAKPKRLFDLRRKETKNEN